MLRPKPVDYEQRNTLVDVFKKMTNKIFGNNNGFPVVEAFGSFTMDLFTPRSDLDLSVNFSDNTDDRYTRKKKISVIRKFAKVLYSHQRDGICCGVLPVVSARVPILKVIDRGTGIECDISVENKDGMTRSMIFKFISSLDERFRILSYLVKFWAKVHDLNSPRELTMSSMSIISLVTFHLQTRHPPILPPFCALLKDGLDCASVERNIGLFKSFGKRNKESVAELFVSLISKLLSAESLWEHGLCASNFEASWISKTWKKGVGNLSVEDFLDRSQNFARSVGKVQMQKICKCLRDCALNLFDFMRGKIDTSKLKTILFGRLSPDALVSKPRFKHAKRKRKSQLNPERRYAFQKRAKHGVHDVQHANATNATGLLTSTPARVMPLVLHQRPTQFNTQIVHIPWPCIIPSGFGYGLLLQMPVAPLHGKGILGPPPGNLIPLNNGIQQL
uniref:Poly(A) RNA polymerase mitochondrial-like central palm domain-containing protein n=1 Tax=Arundo donax TaxID=35708 RepID=A0A0A9F9M2_ARUDO